ncbi:MAG TPA: arylamine N-acetyltransferase [Candidatus Krumholzibacteria bacterium]|nr:arylamine N-acetyltransferase [Candidatus Krumholzibacteria bacterium]
MTTPIPATTFPLAAYLARLGLDALPPATPEGLRTLVQAQHRAIAFENLDPLAGRPVDLEPAAVHAKILGAGRGGYCFELNGLLHEALQAAGFPVEVRLARVAYRRPGPGPLSHQVLLVDTGGRRWLADAGFGGPGLLEPVPFVQDSAFTQDGVAFRLTSQPDGGVMLAREIDGQWCDVYLVCLQPVLPVDITVGNHFVSTWERSPFRAIFMVARPRGAGLVALQGADLVTLDPQLRPTGGRPLAGPADLVGVMAAEFGVTVAPATAAAAWNTVQAAAASAARSSG